MKKLTQVAMFLLLVSTTALAQTFQFNQPGTSTFFVTVSPSLLKGDTMVFHSVQLPGFGPDFSACEGDLVTSPNPACPGQWVTLTASPTQGIWPYTYLWWNGFTGSQQQLQFWNQTDLWVQVTDATGCSWFADGTIFMSSVGVTPVISGNTAFCSGGSTTLSASGTGTFSWTGPNNFTSTNQSITVSQPGMYTVTVNNGGCSGTASVNVTMNPTATVSISGPNGFCPGTSAQLVATSSAPNTVFSWTGPNGFTASGSSITVNVPGAYTATGTAPGFCASTSTKAIVAFPAPSSDITSTFNNGVTTLSIEPGLSAFWTGPNGFTSTNATITVPNQSGPYKATVTDQNGCVATSSGVKVNNTPCAPPCPLPVAGFTFAPSPQNAQVIVFTNTTNTGGTNTTYAWTFGDNSTSMATSPTHAYQPGNYTVVLTATNTCGSSTFTQTLSIACPPPVANFNFSTNGATATFTNTSTGTNLVYLWNFGDGSTSTQTNPTYTYANTGNYLVTLKVTNNCGAQNTIQKIVGVTVCIQPDAQFNLPQSGGLANLQFTNTSTGSGPMWYTWTFGDGSPQSFDEDPIHTFPHAGVFNVKLKVDNGCGTDQVVKTLVVLNAIEPAVERNEDFRVYPTVTTSQFYLEGSTGMYILTDPQGRSKKLIKTE